MQTIFEALKAIWDTLQAVPPGLKINGEAYRQVVGRGFAVTLHERTKEVWVEIARQISVDDTFKGHSNYSSVHTAMLAQYNALVVLFDTRDKTRLEWEDMIDGISEHPDLAFENYRNHSGFYPEDYITEAQRIALG